MTVRVKASIEATATLRGTMFVQLARFGVATNRWPPGPRMRGGSDTKRSTFDPDMPEVERHQSEREQRIEKLSREIRDGVTDQQA
jgi:hypothetical protein